MEIFKAKAPLHTHWAYVPAFKISNEEDHCGDHIKIFLAVFVFSFLIYANASPCSDPAGN